MSRDDLNNILDAFEDVVRAQARFHDMVPGIISLDVVGKKVHLKNVRYLPIEYGYEARIAEEGIGPNFPFQYKVFTNQNGVEFFVLVEAAVRKNEIPS
jgi:hypothetical protein